MKTFFPDVWELVEASKPHPRGMYYKVSHGTEIWFGGQAVKVMKIQMAPNGVAVGRLTPSFSEEDIDKIAAAVERVRARVKNNDQSIS